MFERIRIWWDFLSYEADAKRAWHQRAERLFSTRGLRVALEGQVHELNQQSDRAYGASIARLETCLRQQAAVQREAEAHLECFRRDFKHELDKAYSDLESIKAEQAGCRAELTEAYSELEDAKSAIDSWHGKSKRTPWLFGNSGKMLPQHSLFGQSFGDLEGYKEDRGQAVEDIGRLRTHQRELSQRFDESRSIIQAIRTDRESLFELKRQRYTVHKLEETIRVCQSKTQHFRSEAERLIEMRAAFDKVQRVARGINRMELEIAVIESKKRTFLAQFDKPSELENRRAAHRQQWEANRSKQR